MQDLGCPELSIIVPTYNEAAILPSLFDALGRQSGLSFEVIIADGGSTDDTLRLVEDYAQRDAFPLRVVRSAAGRGRQMNAGAEQARAINLLFLHADSCLVEPYALADGLFLFTEEVSRRGSDSMIGHFALRFVGYSSRYSKAYAFYETKARFSRPGCIHGDQGFLLRRSFFTQLGGFDCSLPYFEDERLVRSVFGRVDWVLLPAEIQTFARRFEVEGLLQRQILNAVILTAATVGLERFLLEVPELYRCQGNAARLDLLPFLLKLKEMLRQMSWRQRLRTWYRIGTYARDNGWQLLLALDVRLGLRRQPGYRGESTPILDRYERSYDRFTAHAAGRLLLAAIFYSGFQCATLALRGCRQQGSFFRGKEVRHVAERD